MQSKFKHLKVCIVGYGSIGRRHAENLKKLGVEYISVFRTGKAHPDTPNYDDTLNFFYDFEDVLEYKPDAIFICNPTNLHSEYTLKAVENKYHVFIEKPIGHNLDNINNIKHLIEKHRLISSVGYMMRFDPLIIKAKEIIDNQDLGDITSAIFEWGTHLPSWHKWEDYSQSYASKKESGGGLLLTCSHEIDLIRFLCGDIKSTIAHGGKKSYLDIEVEDHADVLSKHESGITSYLHLDWFQQPGQRSFKIIGENGNINWDFHANTLVINIDDKPRDVLHLASDRDVNDLYIDNIEDFLDAIVNNRESKCNFNEGITTLTDTLKILETMRG
jgi:predicted dehydrogenase